jgi:hypothetical protein
MRACTILEAQAMSTISVLGERKVSSASVRVNPQHRYGLRGLQQQD